MLFAVDPVHGLLEGQKRLQPQLQANTVLVQPRRTESIFFSEAAVACEEISPCCCACANHRTTGPEYEGEAEPQTREMYFCACGKSRQHPLKAAPYRITNADAFLIDSQILGVADGVGSVETEGYDPALLPVELLTQCSLLFRLRQQNAAVFDTESETLWATSGGPTDRFDIESFPRHILGRAHASCVSLGSTTCVLGMLDCSRRRLYTVNVGDSKLLVLRRVPDTIPTKTRTITVAGGRETVLSSRSDAKGGPAGAAVSVFPLRSPSLEGTAEQEAGSMGETTGAKGRLEAITPPETEAKEQVVTAGSKREPIRRTAQPKGRETDTRAAEEERQQRIRYGEKAETTKRRGSVPSNKSETDGGKVQAKEESACVGYRRRVEGTRETRGHGVLGSEEGRHLHQSEEQEETRYQVIYRTEVQQHFFNCPYQLTRMPDIDCSQEAVLRRTQASADLGYCDVKGGDIVILGSDGLFDNLFEDEIVAVINTFCCSSEAGKSPVVDPSLLTDQLLNMALAAAAGHRVEVANCENDRRRSCFSVPSSPHTPFSQAAYEELGRCVEGGKPDDTTVVVAFVVETERQELTRGQEQKQAQPSRHRQACVENSILSKAGSPSKCEHTGEKSVGRKAAVVADRGRRIEFLAREGAVPCTQKKGPVPAAGNATSERNTVRKTGSSVIVASGLDTTVPVSPEGGSREGVPDVIEFAWRHGATVSNEELGISVCEEIPQPSTAIPGRAVMSSSVAVHGRYQSSSLSAVAERSDHDSEATVLNSEQVDRGDTAATDSRWSQISSSPGMNKTEQRVVCSEEPSHGGASCISVQRADVAQGAPTREVQDREEDTIQLSAWCEKRPEPGRSTAQVARDQRGCMPTTAADTWLREQGERYEQLPPRANTESSVAVSRGPLTISSADSQQRLPTIRGWWLFRQPQPDSHLTLVMRAAPTPKSRVSQTSGIREKTESAQTHRYTGQTGIISLHRKLGNTESNPFDVDHLHLTDERTATTWANKPSTQREQMQIRDSAIKVASRPESCHTGVAAGVGAMRAGAKRLEKTRCRAAPSPAANVAVLTRRASIVASDEELDPVLSRFGPLKASQDAGASSVVPQRSGDGETSAAFEVQIFAEGATNATRGGSSWASEVSDASRAPSTVRTTRAAFPGVASLANGGAYLKAAGGASSRHYPVSVSALLACSRKSFPPINAASLLSLRVHPQATCLQQIYAADKLKAAAAAVGAGTSPACVAAVHMEISDRRGR